jgi:O-acetylserine/cysteine efflux transporter
MKIQHIGLGVLVAAIWGFNFVPLKIALDSFPPLFLLALRFTLAGLPLFFLPKPSLSWKRIFAIAMPLFLIQFALLFGAMNAGMPPGLASITLQVQAFFTILIGALFLHEKPTKRQLIGSGIALSGLGCIALTIGGDVTFLGLILCVLSAASWASGNVMLRQSPQDNILALIVWMSAAVAFPAIIVSFIFDGPTLMLHAVQHASMASWLSLGYVVICSTLVGYGMWGLLMRHYPAGMVAPFALLVPIFGTASSALVFGEQFGTFRLVGMALILGGLGVIMLRMPAKPIKDGV